MITIQALQALTDNYIWLIVHEQSKHTIVVDPGEAQPVLTQLQKQSLTLTAIIITHHHWDHTKGITEILQHYSVPVYAPATESIQHCDYPLEDNDQIAWPDIGVEFNILSIPGHTRGHIAYYGHNSLFCGDTLFTGGCGRLFEGTAAQLHASLNRISALPASTEIYCGHEYTQANLRFASVVEPKNPALLARIKHTNELRDKLLPTVPSTLGIERDTNPFLRCQLPSVQQAVNQHFQQNLTAPVEIFAALRQWKDNF